MMWALALMAGAWGAEDCGRLKGRPGSRQVALLVGVSDYLVEIDGSIDLEGPAADADRVKHLLVDHFGFPGSNVCLLQDERATLQAFRATWSRLFGKLAEGDTVVVYFAGHGSRNGGGAPTYLLHDSRTGDVPDLHEAELARMIASVYEQTPDINLWIDASHGPGPHRADVGTGHRERWVPSAGAASKQAAPEAPEAPEMPQLVTLHAARDGMPALERDGKGIFTTALIQALRTRGKASWHQLQHDVSRWVAAQNSWQRTEATGDLARSFGTRGVAVSPWTVSRVEGAEVRLKGPPMLGWSPGAVVAVTDGERVKAHVRLDGVSAGAAIGTAMQGAKQIQPGDPVRLEVPGEDISAVEVRIDGDVTLGPQIRQALAAEPVLAQTVHIVDGSADFVLRPGPNGTVDIVGGDGVRRNRLPAYDAADAKGVAETLGLYARQASLLALSGEVPEAYPNDMFEVRVLPADQEGSCARTPYVPTEVATPFARIPMCNTVRLQVRLLEDPVQPLHVGVLYLANNGSIVTWPRNRERPTLAKAGDVFEQVLGWVTPPLYTPDRLLVFGTHEPVPWHTLEQKVIPDATRSRGSEGPGFFVAAVSGTRTRGMWAEQAEAPPAWTASMVTIEIVADPSLWSEEERDTTATCGQLRKQGCAPERADY